MCHLARPQSVLLLTLLISGKTWVSATEDDKIDSQSKTTRTNSMKADSSYVTISSSLLERLMDDYRPENVAELFDYLSIDPEEQRKIYPAYQIAEKAAKEKQRTLSAPGTGKIVMKVGDSIAIRALGEQAIDACVTVFSKNLKLAISNNTQKVLCQWARQRLKQSFTKTFTIQLQKEVVTMSPDGKSGFGSGGGSNSYYRTPRHLRDYYFRVHRLIDGKPSPGTETFSPASIQDGHRYDFLTIETGEDAAKPPVEKPGEAPKMEKGR